MNLERVATLLASGLPPSQVAGIVGVTPARISQLIKEDHFAQLLAVKTAEANEKNIEEISISAKYTAAEHLLIEQVMQMAPVSELRDVTAALRVVAERQEKAKSRLNPIVHSTPTINNIVQLQLPAHTVNEMPVLQLSAEKEVISIGNRDLAPLSSKGVTELFRNLNTEGTDHEPTTALPSPEASTTEALPQASLSAKLTEGARKFLDSLEPAPYLAS